MPLLISDLLHRLRSHEATSPRLTWYGPGGERVELSGRVLDNWVAKTSNLLVEELDAGVGTTVLLELPAHWRGLCWALACWQVGATVQFDPTETADIVVSSEPESAPAAPTTVAVALGALDLRWRGTLLPGTVDYAAEVRSYADVYFPDGTPPGDAMAVQQAATYGELLSGFAHPAVGGRTLVRAQTLADAASRCLGIWAAGGSVVLVHPEARIDDALIAAERITES